MSDVIYTCSKCGNEEGETLRLRAENEKLKAELERVTKERDEAMAMSRLCFSSSSAARAEVERLKADCKGFLDTANICSKEKAEALEKLGDAQSELTALREVEKAARQECNRLGLSEPHPLCIALSRLDKEKANECCSGCPDCKGIIWTGVGD